MLANTCRFTTPFKRNGFTLTELMVVLAISGILLAVAIPSFQSQLQRTRRSDAQTALLNLSVLMTHYYTENGTFIGASTPSHLGTDNASPQGHYSLSISNLSANGYTLSATPTGAQATDSCGTLTLTNQNLRGPSAECWD